jgi:hypothetical protein
MVKRKAYKSTATTFASAQNTDNDNDNEKEDNQNNYTNANSNTTYLGYAIVVFRDAEEAALVHRALGGLEISATYVMDLKDEHQDSATTTTTTTTATHSTTTPEASWAASIPNFWLKVRPVEHNGTTKIKSKAPSSSTTSSTTTPQEIVAVGQDPPLVDQLRPLSTQELQARIQQIQKIQSRRRIAKTANTTMNNAPKKDTVEELKINDLTLGGKTNESSGLVVLASEDQQHEFALEQAVQVYQQRTTTTSTDTDTDTANEDTDAANGSPLRPVRHYKGRLLPLPLRTTVLDILKTLRWAVPNHRSGLTSERYLVLLTKVKKRDPHYGDLRDACRAIMDWADPNYFYSGIAVTKNFCGSPHIDGCDQTYQYAVSLGDFDGTKGGQLCIEGSSSCDNDDNEYDSDSSLSTVAGSGGGTSREFVNVVETHNRIARLDGRHVHWVRTFGQGDRYSLIFYDTSDRHVTPILSSGVDVDYLEAHHRRGEKEHHEID